MMKNITFGLVALLTVSCHSDQFNVEKPKTPEKINCPFKASDKDLDHFVDENWGQKFINYNGAISVSTGHVQTSKCEIVFALDTGGGTYALTKYKSDMTLDKSFGTNGFALGNIAVAGANLRGGIGIDKNDDFFLGFQGIPGTKNVDFIAYKIKSNGQVAADFGVNGRVDIDLGGGPDHIGGIVPLPDGRILVHGQDPASYSSVVRLLANGALDTSYGTAGKLALRPTGSTIATSYNDLIADDGVYIIGTSAGTAAGYRCMVAKLDLNGDLITSWGINGFVEADANSAIGTFDACYSARLDNSGKLYIFGESGAGAIIVKIHAATGAFDTSFDTDGVTYNFITGGDNYSYGGYVLESGKIILISSATAWEGNIGITLLNADGSLDTTFSPVLNDLSITEHTPGKLILNVGPHDYVNTHGIFEADGQIYLYFTTDTNGFKEQVIYRFNI